MKKRIGAVLLAGVMVLSMTGCSSGKAKKYSKYVKLGDYKGVEYTLDVAEVTDDDIDSKIDSFLDGLKETEDITDRAVQKGDTVNIDYVGTKDGKAFDGGTAEGYDLEIGSGSFIDGFEDGLIGHEIGEKVSLDLTFPKDYQSKDLAGQDVNFEVTINSIKVSKVPTLSDKLVADNTEYDTIDAYKESIRKELEASNEESATKQAKSDVFKKVVDNSEITGYDEKEVDDLIDKEFKSFKETAQTYESYGYSYEDVLASNGYSSEDELKEGITQYVKDYLNQVMVLYCIADKENITVSSKEIDSKVKEYMDTYSVKTEDEVYDYFGEDYFEISILSEKVMDFLMENAKKVDSTEETTEADSEDGQSVDSSVQGDTEATTEVTDSSKKGSDDVTEEATTEAETTEAK